MYSAIGNELTQWADALFASTVQCSDEPSVMQVRHAAAGAFGRYGGQGCAARVAQAYGEDPETAAGRMRWARTAVASAFGVPQPARARETGRYAALACAA